ncbi:MAG TPA: CRISPR-associated helicase Cas3' [Chloroflexota bacterium]|nr:CRISPR-associated helicase Cas3' [Chloroflexota bacterium]
MAYAHSKNTAGERHDLVKHLVDVAERARDSANKFGASDLAYWAGLWHDLGKFHPSFQQYLLDCEAAPGKKLRGPDHKRAGSSLAAQKLPPLALLIKGHHGGLPARKDLPPWLKERAYQEAIETSLAIARAQLGAHLDLAGTVPLPTWVNDALQGELLLRMLFSALVDADDLDTERHFNPDRTEARVGTLALAELWRRFEEDQEVILATAEDTPVNRIRREVYEECLAAAEQTPGFFCLTVPTGGGKTRSGLAFALRHALAHGLDRVIFAIPYTTIIDQTAQVYRAIFRDERAVLEHHSGIAAAENEEDAPVTPDAVWARLAIENWDAPIVVTTNVQLFQSLLGHRTSACRKLHNVARTVIVLDEVQTLPPHLLEPLLDVLRSLVAHYGVSIVLCTATQPALDASPGFNGLPDVREIVHNPARHFAALKRVTYEWPCLTEKWSWAHTADELRGAPGRQGLAVVNTKADALALLDALGDPSALHLSTLLCGAHRRAVLDEVRRRLATGEPCLLAATQVVEAGVDLSFPLVLRAMGPLDRIVQAAGRCNREGRLSGNGRVVVFEPEEGSQPPGAYRTGTNTTEVLLRGGRDGLELSDPSVYVQYFHRFYQGIDLDREKVQDQRKAFDYPEVAWRSRLIDDEGLPVVVRFRGGRGSQIDALLEDLQRYPQRGRAILRRLQPYIVSVRQNLLQHYVAQGLTLEVMPGLWQWFGKYDDVRGLGAGGPDIVRMVVSE